MKSFVTLMLCLLSMTTFAQVHDEIYFGYGRI